MSLPSGYAAMTYARVADLDGDGRLDLVYKADATTVVAALNRSDASAGDGSDGSQADATVPTDGGADAAGNGSCSQDGWCSELPMGSTGSTGSFYGVWGSGPNDVWIAGDTMLHWDGSALAPANSGTTQPLQGVWGSGPNDVWSVGDHGTILHWDGSVWSPSPNDQPDASFAGVWGTGPNDIWAFGCVFLPAPEAACTPVILRWDGSVWSPSPGYLNRLYGLWGTGPNDIWAAAYADGPPMHWNGSYWPQGSASGEYAVPRCIWGFEAQRHLGRWWSGSLALERIDLELWFPQRRSRSRVRVFGEAAPVTSGSLAAMVPYHSGMVRLGRPARVGR